jgi:hypothetical protein
MSITITTDEKRDGRVRTFLEKLMGVRYDDALSTREEIEARGFKEITDTFGPTKMVYAKGSCILLYNPKTDEVSVVYEKKYDEKRKSEQHEDWRTVIDSAANS